MNAVPQLGHALDALLCGGVQTGLDHHGVFPVVHLSVHHDIAVILHVGVCGNGILYGFILTEIRQLGGSVFAANALHRCMELRGKVRALDGRNCKVLPAVLRAFRCLPPQHHLRVFDEILIDSKAVRVLSKVYPVRFNVNRTISFL